MSFSLTMMAASVYQMTRGSVMIFTAIFSVFFLKTKIYRFQYVSLIIIFLGISLVGLGALFHTKEDASDESKTSIVGVISLIIAQLFSAAQFVVEEKLVNKYQVHPLQMVGWEGLFGFGYYTVLLFIFYFIKCDVSNKLCYVNGDEEARLEDFIFAFKQLGSNISLLFFALGYIVSIAFYNFLGITITKYVSSPARAVMDNGRTVLIWLFFLLMPGIPDNWKEDFIVLELIGFILLVFGTILFNEFIRIPCLGYKKDQNLVDREKLIEENI